MSYETGTASGIEDLLVKLHNFLQANGWTADVDYASAGQSPAYGIIHRKVDNASPLGSDPQNEVNLHVAHTIIFGQASGDLLGFIPMRDYVSGAPNLAVEVGTTSSAYTAPTSHGQTYFPTSPFEKYHFFESDYYCHIVVEYAAGFFRHTGFGQLIKFGKWFGGEYYYGHTRNQTAGFIESADLTFNSEGPFDIVGTTPKASTLLYAALLNGDPIPYMAGRQSPESKWFCTNDSSDGGSGVTVDADGRDVGKIQASSNRRGPHCQLFYQARSAFNGYRPMYPIPVWTRDDVAAPDNCTPLGTMPDVRCISMQDDLEGGDEFTIGSDTWVAFPLTRKRATQILDDTEYSKFYGLAYKKVTT